MNISEVDIGKATCSRSHECRNDGSLLTERVPGIHLSFHPALPPELPLGLNLLCEQSCLTHPVVRIERRSASSQSRYYEALLVVGFLWEEARVDRPCLPRAIFEAYREDGNVVAFDRDIGRRVGISASLIR